MCSFFFFFLLVVSIKRTNSESSFRMDLLVIMSIVMGTAVYFFLVSLFLFCVLRYRYSLLSRDGCRQQVIPSQPSRE